jgi:hypothetical protein
MSTPIAPLGADSARPSSFTVTSGLDLLEDWSAHATQPQKNIVYEIIFAVADKTVFTRYTVVDDAEKHMEFFVLTKNDLVVKVRIDSFDSFGITYIGSCRCVPGLDRIQSAPISSATGSVNTR